MTRPDACGHVLLGSRDVVTWPSTCDLMLLLFSGFSICREMGHVRLRVICYLQDGVVANVLLNIRSSVYSISFAARVAGFPAKL
eukprot:4215073-Pleurochrysis_carterae.AAC.2